jgi:PKD repeat protein
MYRTFTKSLFIFSVFIAFAFKPVFAQTITIQHFVSGTYTPGSTITAPFSLSGTCIKTDNKFNLYLADASGNIISNTPIGTFTGFYGTFVNGIIPASTPAGTYTLVVKSTDPAATSTAPSPTFTVANGTAVKVDVAGPAIGSDPNVFGTCAGSPNNQYFFTNNSGTASANANFYNETAQTNDGTVVLAQTGSFTAQAANYTITVQTSNGSSIGTESYLLINNVVNNNFGSTNSNTVCLPASGGGILSYNLDITSANGLQKNFPGNTYQVNWGDGVTTIYTICDLVNSNGQISHTYTTGSCGNTANGQNNAFEVDVQPQSPYCGSVGTRITSYARVIRAPSNSFTFPPTACTNSAVTFTNTSDPGQDPNSNVNSCNNVNARYTWSVDGQVIFANARLNQNFVYTFPTHGTHTVTLALQNGSGPCSAASATNTICIQNAPAPAFTLPATACLSNPLAPTDRSLIDEICNINPYLWTVTGPGAVIFVGGTNNGSHQPQFQFSTPGVYTVILSISSASCATATVSRTINIDAPPAITMSPNSAVCGTNLTYSFNPNPGPTQTTITGTAVPQANTYTWTVTGDPGYSFVGGTTANSQYPQIKFTNFATYTISVTETNSCGTASKSQNITFQNAPTVTISASANPICPGSSVTLTATINGSHNSVQWASTNSNPGTFSAPTTEVTEYTPSAAEIATGKANLTIDVKTSLTGQCADIQQNITINIYPVDNITSATVKQICTRTSVNYNITATDPGSTYTWTATLTSGAASGFAASGSGPLINDVITNNGSGDAIVTYTITPTDSHGCTGPPATLKVTVKPLSIVTATPTNNTICSGSTAGISLSPSIPNTTYTWTSSVIGSITNNSQQSTPTATNIINDVLNNTGPTAGSVTYVITPYNTTCPGPSTTVTINVQPLPAPANAGPNDEQCNITSYTLNGNSPPAGAGKWTVVPQAGITFADDTKPNTTVNGLIPGTTYQFTWTITIPGCQSSSNTITLKDDAASAGGTTAGAATVCAGSNNGQITLSGQVGNILRWEFSTDNGTTWKPIPNITATQQYVNLNATTQYRAVVQSGVCAIAFSSVTTITVNPPAVQSNAGPNDAVCNSTTYTLKANSPSPYTGQWTVTAGPAGATFADATKPNTTVSGLIPGNIYQFTWTITAVAPCPTNSSAVVITDDALSVGGSTGANATVCSGSNSGIITLSGQVGNVIRWELSTDNGATWQPIANTGTTQQYINIATTTQYRAVIQSGSCSAATSTVTTITVNQPAVQANAGPNQEICNTTTYTLQGNNPAPGNGQWMVTSGPAGATFSDATQPNAVVSGLVPGNTYVFTWSITPQAPCASNSSAVTIIVDPATVGGITASDASVCAGSNSGTITLSGQVGKIIRWESSTDNGATWAAIVNTSTTQQYLNLNKPTQYRAVVQSGICQMQFSSVTTITVNQPVVPANAGGNQTLCGAVSVTLQGNDPTPFKGTWSQTAGPAATIVSPNSPQTQVTGLTPGNDYTFAWTIQGQPPCANSTSFVQIHDATDVTPSFTVDKQDACGTYTANFTNTSTFLTGTTFSWDFGDGSAPSSAVSPSHQFAQRNDGKDTAYTVSLSIVNNCVPRPPFTMVITVRPKDPVASILPDQLNGCSPFVIRVANKSPGNNTGYVFYLYDGSTLIQQINKIDKSTAVFNPVTSPPQASKIYTVYMVATGFCNNSTESTHVPITVSPPTVTAQMFIQGSVSKGCAPLAATFVNNSSGGDSYFYTIYDVNNQPIAHLVAGTANYPYTFNNIGTYFVSITGTNGCSSSESPKTRVDVYALPQPQFDADIKTGCKQITVNFKNLTPDDLSTPATSLTYTWDFGDNTQTTGFTPPPHVYNDKNSPYTVTLTATNSGTGCSNVIAKSNFILVHGLAGTDFTERPDSVTIIPNYTFSFRDQTTGNPIKWIWSFGDGKGSTSQNPTHIYPDTGLYKVTLTATSEFGCDSTKSHFVRINGIPGQLFLPNAFEPDGSSQELRIFMAKGSGIMQWHMQIFNNYSQLVWETTRLDSKGAPVDGWDGTFKGVPVKQGVYVWQVSATFINGTEWKGNSYNSGSLPKRTGVIHLIR